MCPHSLSKDRCLQLLRFPVHQQCPLRVLQVGRKEWLGVSITINFNRVVLNRYGQDMANWTQNWKGFFMEEEGSSIFIMVSEVALRDEKDTDGLGFLSAPL